MAVNVSEKLERFAIGYKRRHFEAGKTMQGDSGWKRKREKGEQEDKVAGST